MILEKNTKKEDRFQVKIFSFENNMILMGIEFVDQSGLLSYFRLKSLKSTGVASLYETKSHE